MGGWVGEVDGFDRLLHGLTNTHTPLYTTQRNATHRSVAGSLRDGPLGRWLQQGWTEPATRYMLAPPISPDDIPGRVLEAIQRWVGRWVQRRGDDGMGCR